MFKLNIPLIKNVIVGLQIIPSGITGNVFKRTKRFDNSCKKIATSPSSGKYNQLSSLIQIIPLGALRRLYTSFSVIPPVVEVAVTKKFLLPKYLTI